MEGCMRIIRVVDSGDFRKKDTRLRRGNQSAGARAQILVYDTQTKGEMR